MSASHAPCLSQLVCAATPDLIEAEKAALKVKFIAMSVALVAEAKCMPDNREDLWEEKVMWLQHWEKRLGKVFPLVKCGRELNVNTKIDVADGPVVAEVDEAYEWWVAEEIAQLKVDKDVRMEEEASQGIEGQGASAAKPVASIRMTHVEVPQLACKRSRQAVTEGNDDDKLKITIPLGSVLHVVPCAQCALKGMSCTGPSSKTCDGCVKMKQRCEKSNKGTGKKVQAGASAPKAGPSKQAHNDDDDDDNDVEVVETCACGKGKVPVHGGFDGKTASDISQALGMVRAEAVAVHAANLRLQVRIEQLLEALEKLGVE
ncbi:hypothetical protein BKA82DRAFT_32424 [Pisolithus tinctorius]|uniref:Zn(2)-C6 fungal-type domain-containing protein n=1 Tax=Pisolithus tinctorius Marx 270 TaxID=870435 RepID=A0A0C3NPU9_PISTI|nr:hypothetical protein BKA82DRAFT_32424 [Pisolithus tinctorius]KIN97318.1 hypothetical protein M404DRAFT_32424 [Pisolithus tinctorius Marx 270]